MEGEIPNLQFSIDDCFGIFDVSFTRLKYFSRIASNLDIDHLPVDWGIQGRSIISFMHTPPASTEEKKRLIDHYKHFVHCHLVRDCIESFALSLDKFFFVLMINGKKIRANRPLGDCLSEEEKNLIKKFDNAGLSSKEGKTQLLKSQFGLTLSEDNQAIVTSLKDIRNCFSHSNGYVRDTDGKKDAEGKRKFIWKAMHIFGKGEETGREFDIKSGESMPEPGMVCMKLQDHETSFHVGQQLSFTPLEAYEIGFSLWRVGINFKEEAGNKLNIIPREAA